MDTLGTFLELVTIFLAFALVLGGIFGCVALAMAGLWYIGVPVALVGFFSGLFVFAWFWNN